MRDARWEQRQMSRESWLKTNPEMSLASLEVQASGNTTTCNTMCAPGGSTGDWLRSAPPGQRLTLHCRDVQRRGTVAATRPRIHYTALPLTRRQRVRVEHLLHQPHIGLLAVIEGFLFVFGIISSAANAWQDFKQISSDGPSSLA